MRGRKSIKKAGNGELRHESSYAGETSVRVCSKPIKVAFLGVGKPFQLDFSS